MLGSIFYRYLLLGHRGISYNRRIASFKPNQVFGTRFAVFREYGNKEGGKKEICWHIRFPDELLEKLIEESTFRKVSVAEAVVVLLETYFKIREELEGLGKRANKSFFGYQFLRNHPK